MSRPPNLELIADDYGLGEGHDKAIRTLLKSGVIDGTSVMSTLCTSESAQALKGVISEVQSLGLHFTLTHGAPFSLTRNQVMLAALLGFRRDAFRGALQQQWDTFVRLFGFAPAYIDGHEHVHSFWGIRQELVSFAREKGVSVRSMRLLEIQGLKQRVIDQLGRGVYTLSTRQGVVTNERFAGVLPLEQPLDAVAELRRQLGNAAAWCRSHPDQTLCFMVHPGSAEDVHQIAGHPAVLRSLEASLLTEMQY